MKMDEKRKQTKGFFSSIVSITMPQVRMLSLARPPYKLSPTYSRYSGRFSFAFLFLCCASQKTNELKRRSDRLFLFLSATHWLHSSRQMWTSCWKQKFIPCTNVWEKLDLVVQLLTSSPVIPCRGICSVKLFQTKRECSQFKPASVQDATFRPAISGKSSRFSAVEVGRKTSTEEIWDAEPERQDTSPDCIFARRWATWQ